jgi:hypothetical protein
VPKIFFIAAVALSSIVPNSSSAQMVRIGSSDSDTVDLEVSTIRNKNGYIQFWVQSNDSNMTSKSPSLMALMRVRCDDEEIATASTVRYSMPNGMGEVVSTNNQQFPVYAPIVPGSIGEEILKFVCAHQAGESWALRVLQESIDGAMAAESAAAAADATMGNLEHPKVKKKNP